jgi:hypothetical protein
MWTVISGIFGGLLRLAPEVLKMWDAKNERKHELDMQDKALEFQKLKGDQRVEEISVQGAADYNVDALGVLKTAIEGQDKPSGVAWVDAFSKLIRPLITMQWVVILYPGVIIWSFILLLQANMPVADALGKVFGEPEKALVAFIVDFWFVGRTLRSK